MLNIIKSSANLSKKDAFRLANTNGSSRMIDLAGKEIEISKWLYATTIETRNDGETLEKDVLYIEQSDGTIMGSVSPTFINSFMNIADTFGDDFHRIRIVKGISKNGREYVTW